MMLNVSGAESQPKSNLVHFGYLMAIIYIIYIRINWRNLMQFKQ